MGTKDRSLFNTLILTLIPLTAIAIHQCLSDWKLAEFRVPHEFSTGGGVHHPCDIRIINCPVNNVRSDESRCLNSDITSSLHEVQFNKLDNIGSMIRGLIHSNCRDLVIAQSHYNQCGITDHILDYVLLELIALPKYSVNHVNSSVATTEGCMRLSPVLPIRVSALTSSSQPIPCSSSNTNNITNITSI